MHTNLKASDYKSSNGVKQHVTHFLALLHPLIAPVKSQSRTGTQCLILLLIYIITHLWENDMDLFHVQLISLAKLVGMMNDHSHCLVKIDDIPIPSEGQNSMIYPLAVDWAHGRRDLCGLTRLPVCVGPLVGV